jgi:hypothetical protein
MGTWRFHACTLATWSSERRRVATAIDVGKEPEELAPVQAPPAGAQPERGHERAKRGRDHETSRSASQMPAQSAAGASAMRRSSGIMAGTVARGVAQAVSLLTVSHWKIAMSTAKEEPRALLDKRPDDSSSEEIVREFAFHVMVQRGLADSDAQWLSDI